MKPNDILEYRCPTYRIVWQWRIHSICLGATKQESLIEVSPIMASNGETTDGKVGTVWVPEPMTRLLTLVPVDLDQDGDQDGEKVDEGLEAGAFNNLMRNLGEKQSRERMAEKADGFAGFDLTPPAAYFSYGFDPKGLSEQQISAFHSQFRDVAERVQQARIDNHESNSAGLWNPPIR